MCLRALNWDPGCIYSLTFEIVFNLLTSRTLEKPIMVEFSRKTNCKIVNKKCFCAYTLDGLKKFQNKTKSTQNCSAFALFLALSVFLPLFLYAIILISLYNQKKFQVKLQFKFSSLLFSSILFEIVSIVHTNTVNTKFTDSSFALFETFTNTQLNKSNVYEVKYTNVYVKHQNRRATEQTVQKK